MEEIDRLTRLIDQILMLARAEAGQIRLTRAPVDLGELAGSLVEQLEPVAEARSVTLSVRGVGRRQSWLVTAAGFSECC